jgi:hypothetical protein
MTSKPLTVEDGEHAYWLVQQIVEKKTPGFLQPQEAEALLVHIANLGTQDYDKGFREGREIGFEHGRNFAPEETYH